MVINMPPRWGKGAGVAGILVRGGSSASWMSFFRADHPNKYDGDDGCGSMMMEDGKMKLISDISGQ